MKTNESVVSINYKKHGEPSDLSQHSTVKDAIEWFKQHSPNDFEYISLTDGNGYQIVGYGNVLDVYDRNSDLYGGSVTCIHPIVNCQSGGGVKCDSCSAWFCY